MILDLSRTISDCPECPNPVTRFREIAPPPKSHVQLLFYDHNAHNRSPPATTTKHININYNTKIAPPPLNPIAYKLYSMAQPQK